jgi:hypothetical protein
MKSFLHSASFFWGSAAFLLIAAGPRLFALDPDAAWRTAAEMAARAHGLRPAMMRMTTTDLDSKGSVISTENQVSRIHYESDGSMRTEILSATRDGKDVSQEKREEAAKQKRQSGAQSMGGFDMPDPLVGKPDSLKLGSARATRLGGRAVWEFPFEAKANGLMSSHGSLRLDAQTGRPIEMEYSFKPLPLGVKYATILVRYSPLEGSPPVVDSVLMRVDANLLVFKKRADFLMEFSEYEVSGSG